MSLRSPLRYKISSWKQLPKCRSNNDEGLRITVAEIVNNDLITGLRIQVVDNWCGVLFSEILNAKGALVSSSKESGASIISYQLDDTTILKELEKYGFLVSYNPRNHLSEYQLDSLKTLRGLHFDKLRILNVYDIRDGKKYYKWYVVGFKVCSNPDWINNKYEASKKEFTDALVSGTAVNISELASMKDFDWSWLDYVANIDDVLKDNDDSMNVDQCEILGPNICTDSLDPEIRWEV